MADGVSIDIELTGLPAIERAMGRLLRRAADLTPLMEDIGAALEASTRDRFERGLDPDGMPWPPSLRAIEEHGQTLVDTARLRDSITYETGRTQVEVGTNVRYAPTHQFGAEIRAQRGPYLHFQIGGRWVRTPRVRIPARPFLGVSRADEDEIGELVNDHLQRAIG